GVQTCALPIYMATTSGGWARNLYNVIHSGTTIDAIGHYGNSGVLNYGYIGGTTYNVKNAIRWGANGNVGIGYTGTATPSYQLEIRTDDYVGQFIRRNNTGGAGSAIGFGNINSTAGYFGDIGFGVINNDFTVRGA